MVRRAGGWGGAGGALALVGALAVAHCHEPTEIVVRVTTDFPCTLLTDSVSLRFGEDFTAQGPAASTSNECSGAANDYVGTLVITPRKAGARITIDVMGTVAPAKLLSDGTCAEGDPGCIHARRSLPFLDGTPLHVPIVLQATCAGLMCKPDETCLGGTCVPDSLDPQQCPTTDCTLDGGTPDAGVTVMPGCGDMSGLLANAAWPMHMACPGQTGVSAYAGPTTAPSLVGTHPTGLPPTNPQAPAEVAIDANDNVYFITLDGLIDSFSAAAPTNSRWAAVIKGPALGNGAGSVALGADGTLYARNDTDVLAIDPATGVVSKSVPSALGSIRSDLTLGAAGIYYSNPSGAVERVPFSLGPALLGPTLAGAVDNIDPIILNGNILIGDDTGAIYKLDPTTLTQLDAFTPGGPIAGLGVTSDGTLRVVWVGGVAAYDPTTHGVAWSHSIPTDSELVAVTSDGAAYTRATDTILRRADASGVAAIGTSPVYPAFDRNGTIYIADSNTGLSAVTATGVPLWGPIPLSGVFPWGIFVGANHDLILLEDMQFAVYR